MQPFFPSPDPLPPSMSFGLFCHLKGGWTATILFFCFCRCKYGHKHVKMGFPAQIWSPVDIFQSVYTKMTGNKIKDIKRQGKIDGENDVKISKKIEEPPFTIICSLLFSPDTFSTSSRRATFRSTGVKCRRQKRQKKNTRRQFHGLFAGLVFSSFSA